MARLASVRPSVLLLYEKSLNFPKNEYTRKRSKSNVAIASSQISLNYLAEAVESFVNFKALSLCDFGYSLWSEWKLFQFFVVWR